MEDSEAATASKPKKKSRRLVKLAMALIVLGGTAGGALYAQGAGLIHLPGLGDDGKDDKKEDPNQPQLVPREDADPENFEVVGGRPIEADKFQVSYYPIEEKFTSNLRDGGGFIQIGVGVSTYYDERVLQAVERHEMALRSAVLMQLADQDPMVVSTPKGKLALKSRLTRAVNEVLEEKEGFGGIDDVYFTSFVMQ
ncbi:MAG: flagellar basal body-associated FliL family protein [Sphingomonadaceae bacterium]|nr:flagellar basal body-associated FliL family protein [Sphingomonadaceae bacterium]